MDIEKNIIDLLAKNYLKGKQILREIELGVCTNSPSDINAYTKIVRHIEESIKYLDGNDLLIIKNEVLLGKRGNWYRDYLSTSSYYRNRKPAYKAFLRCINK